MKKSLIYTVLLVSMLGMFSFWTEPAYAADGAASKPKIGYCEGEEYYEFQYQLYYLLYGMEESQLITGIKDAASITQDSSSRDIWNYVCSQDQSDWSVVLEPTAYLNLTTQNAEKQMKSKKDSVDLWITMGTTAGLAIKESQPNVDNMNFMAADPVQSGMVADYELSGETHMWAQLDPDNFSRTLEIMNDMFQPKKVGLIYADTQEAYIYSGANAVDAYCKSQGIQVTPVYVDDEFESGAYDTYKTQMRQAAEKLSEQVDVFLMTTSLLESKDYEWTLEPFYEKHIPIYSINSVDDVSYGAMMASESSDYQQIGLFGGQAMAQYLEGASLDEIPQIYVTAPCLYVNYKICRKIGFHVPFKQLMGASIVSE